MSSSNLYERWVLNIKPNELGIKNVISDRLMQSINKAMIDLMVTQATTALAKQLLFYGLAAHDVDITTEREASLRAQESVLSVDTELRPTMVGYTMVLEDRLEQVRQVADLSWWRFLWRKLRRQRLEPLPWERINR